MRLSIRPEQMSVIEAVAEESFVRRIADHLLENYAEAAVTLPGDRKTTVAELPEEILLSLVRSAISRARGHGLTFDSSIAAFTAVMFEVSPNFDGHRLSQVMLNDQEIEPDARLDELLDVLTEKNWESIRADYDPAAWELPAEDQGAESQAAESQVAEDQAENKAQPAPDYDKTVFNY